MLAKTDVFFRACGEEPSLQPMSSICFGLRRKRLRIIYLGCGETCCAIVLIL